MVWGESGSPDISQQPPTIPVTTVAEAATDPPEAQPPSDDPTPIPTPLPTSSGPLPIGIISGHLGSDSGAVCDGNIQEVNVNFTISERVVFTLPALGYEVELLGEYDNRLQGYRGRALVSIHADSCIYPEATGFKIARVEDSAVPELEDKLVSCLTSRYQEATGLDFHPGSITPDMTHYHVFYDIDPETPAAIIEVGFLAADRDLLLNRQDLVAQGIVDGLLCFLENEE
jgi:N-acetylmuramoyl-L-alanine amidase